MKECLWEKLFKNTGILVILIGVFVSVMKGFDRLDVYAGAEGVMVSVFFGVLLMSVGYRNGMLRAVNKKNYKDEEYTDAHFKEEYLKKRKSMWRSWLVLGLTAIVFGIYMLVMIISAPFVIDGLIRSGNYEQAFDEVVKSKLTSSQRNAYIEELSPLMDNEFSSDKENSVVLTVDGRKFIVDKDKLYIDSMHADNLLYTAGTYDITATGRFDNDFIYSGNHIIFIEILEGDSGHYKNVVAVDIRTKNHNLVDYSTECYYMDKLTDGRILLSDDPLLVYDPFSGKISKKQLSEKERAYIYSTMG